jgi:hypothetical protein
MVSTLPCRRRALLPLGAGMVLLAAQSAPAHAMTGDFTWALSLQQRYQQDVFRTGEDGPSDNVTGLRAQTGWTGTTPRSRLQFSYTPEFSAYAQFESLNHLDHQLDSSWQMSPGRRSTLGVRAAGVRTEQQPRFQDFEGSEADPVVPRSLRTTASLEPFYSLALNRRWQLDTRASYRQQRYESANLVDTRVLDLEVSSTAQVGRSQRLGGRITGSSIDQERDALEGGYDSFLRLETLWSWVAGGLFSGSAGAGAFRGSGPGVDARLRPTANLILNWTLSRSTLGTYFDYGYSGTGGLGGSSLSQSGGLRWSRSWGKGLRTGAQAGYLRRERLEGALSDSDEVRGYGTDLDLSYVWRQGLGISVQHGLVRQERSGSADLDYQIASVALTYAPRSGWGAPRPSPGGTP